MTTRLPPLTALRAFDAAARHMSFAAAAAELNVTPAALSFQIKSLEDHLGAKVFERHNRAVTLTEHGRILAPGARDGFATLSGAWAAARRSLDQGALSVTAGPAFSSEWLAPRMFKFALANPDIELRFNASLRMLDFDRDDVDIAIRYGTPRDDDLFSEQLFQDWLTPMMTADMAERYPTPEALASAPLIHQDDLRFLDPYPGWDAWFALFGIPAQAASGTHFSQSDHAMDFATSGGGIILGRASLAARKLADGRLVMPYRESLLPGATYRIVCARGAETRPDIAKFRDWVRTEIAALDGLAADQTLIPFP